MKRQSASSWRLELTRRERDALRQLLRRGHTGVWMAARAQAVLLAAGGVSISEIARRVGRDRTWVREWVRRFVRHRLDGLRDVPRSGRPPKFSPRRAA
jgi:transposase-like protein